MYPVELRVEFISIEPPVYQLRYKLPLAALSMCKLPLEFLIRDMLLLFVLVHPPMYRYVLYDEFLKDKPCVFVASQLYVTPAPTVSLVSLRRKLLACKLSTVSAFVADVAFPENVGAVTVPLNSQLLLLYLFFA